jgi:hypothetical protein
MEVSHPDAGSGGLPGPPDPSEQIAATAPQLRFRIQGICLLTILAYIKIPHMYVDDSYINTSFAKSS